MMQGSYLNLLLKLKVIDFSLSPDKKMTRAFNVWSVTMILPRERFSIVHSFQNVARCIYARL